MLRDNLSMQQSCTNPGLPCKKELLDVAYQNIQECQAIWDIAVKKIYTSHNIANAGTKAFAKLIFWNIMKNVLP